MAIDPSTISINPEITPVWKGPVVDGITFSMLSRFLCCRERFRINTVEGLRPKQDFNARIEYGNMWHICEEAYAAKKCWLTALSKYTSELSKKYPMSSVEIVKWYNVCKVQFPIYEQVYANEKKDRTPILQEYTFDIQYVFNKYSKVRLRGKFDSVDLVTEGKFKRIYLQENKTKSEIVETKIRSQLSYDLQTMMYLTVLDYMQTLSEYKSKLPYSLGGVIYNVIKRPLSGGKGTIVRHKPTKKNPEGESSHDYYNRLKTIIYENRNEFFARWRVDISKTDIENFKNNCLYPILSQLLDWWAFMGRVGYRNKSDGLNYHWRHPFGVYNVMDEGGSSELDEYLHSNSKIGLEKVDNLFPELE